MNLSIDLKVPEMGRDVITPLAELQCNNFVHSERQPLMTSWPRVLLPGYVTVQARESVLGFNFST